MTQLPDAIPAEPDPQPPAIQSSNQGWLGKHVCPFCGTIGEKPDRPCARCLMEDTPQTRQSTRWRLGPWYVLQSRNPSAPGMKYATLLALIRKGQISAKTIVRGPTTQQFWRLAGTVKGISREFGICWACGTAVHPTAINCPQCNKSQELPANPDILLENDPTDGKPLYVEISPKSGSPIPKPVANEPNASPARDPLEIRRQANKGNRPTNPMPSAAATMAIAAGLTPPELAEPETKTRPGQMPTKDKILSARDLASAFSLQFNPNSDPVSSPQPPKTKRRKSAGKLVGIAILVLLLLGGITVMSLPSLRDPTITWIRQVAGMAQPPAGATPTETFKISDADRPDWAMKPPVDATPASTPLQQTTPTDSTPTTPTQSNSPTPATPTPQDSTPQQQPQPQPATPDQHPAPGTPVVSSQDLDALAMQMRANGLDAEARHDFAAAQYYYEQIEKLPKEHWPADTDQLLKAAKRMNQSASSDQH
jgi:hypothetical protein